MKAFWKSRTWQFIEDLRDDISTSFGLDSAAGWATFSIDAPLHDRYVYFHFIPKAQHRIWGYKRAFFDGMPLHDIGFGPILLVCCYGFNAKKWL